MYNRGNGHDHIFRNPGNYYYFMGKYYEYMNPYWETLCYCLMPNHFHFLVRVKSLPDNREMSSQYCSRAFSNFSSGYALAFNKQQNRRGSVFMKNFQRKHVCDEMYLKTLICYIHNNPVKDGFVPRAENWAFSSYYEMYNSGQVEAMYNPIIRLFGSKQEFILQHIIHSSPGSIDIPFNKIA